MTSPPPMIEKRVEKSAGLAARILGISRKTINRMCAAGELRARRIPPRGHWRIDYESIIAMLDRMNRPQ